MSQKEIALVMIPRDKVHELSRLITRGIEKAFNADLSEAAREKAIQPFKEGQMLAWTIFEGDEAVAIFTTRMIEDVCLGTRELFIYSFWAFRPLSLRIWDAFYRQLSFYGLTVFCRTLSCTTKWERLKRIARRMGWNQEMVYINHPLHDEEKGNGKSG